MSDEPLRPCVSVMISYPEDELTAPALGVKLRKAANLLKMTSDRDLLRVWDAIDLLADVATATQDRLRKAAAGVKNAVPAAIRTPAAKKRKPRFAGRKSHAH